MQHVVAHDQHQHGEGEQRNVGKESVVTLIFFHVTNGVDVHHQGNEGHHTHHHGGQAVDQKAHFHFQATHHHPGVERLVKARAIHDHTFECHGRQNKGQQHTQNGQAVRQASADPIAAELGSKNTGQDGAHQGGHWHGKQGTGVEGLAHCLTS